MLLAAFLLLLIFGSLSAQNTNSLYSQYAFGSLETPAFGKSRAMGGIGIGLRDNGQINPANPASYSAVDTTNFLFDFGMSAQLTRLKEGGTVQYNPNGYLDYVGMKFALKPHWGVAMGLMPFTKVGYSYSIEEENAFETETNIVTDVKSFSGSGGLNALFLGTSFNLCKGLSLGANLKYIFGANTNIRTVTYDDDLYNTAYFYHYLFSKTIGYDLGLQYEHQVGKKGSLVVGAVFSQYAPFEARSYDVEISADTLETRKGYNYALPQSLGLGLSYNWDRRLTFGLDYQQQLWSDCEYQSVSDSLKNSTRVAFGLEYLPSLLADHYFQAVRYRAGFNYTDTYLKAPGHLKNVGLTFGFGLPLRAQKSMLNIGFEVGKVIIPNASFISETYYKVSLDMSFNELWFFKRNL
jgi:hypothetical protein